MASARAGTARAGTSRSISPRTIAATNCSGRHRWLLDPPHTHRFKSGYTGAMSCAIAPKSGVERTRYSDFSDRMAIGAESLVSEGGIVRAQITAGGSP